MNVSSLMGVIERFSVHFGKMRKISVLNELFYLEIYGMAFAHFLVEHNLHYRRTNFHKGY